jgi:hypothetical protein
MNTIKFDVNIQIVYWFSCINQSLNTPIYIWLKKTRFKWIHSDERAMISLEINKTDILTTRRHGSMASEEQICRTPVKETFVQQFIYVCMWSVKICSWYMIKMLLNLSHHSHFPENTLNTIFYLKKNPMHANATSGDLQ